MMYGQMTAGSWIYIGTQGILQGTFETFAEAARQHFGGTLRGTVTLTAGLGGMGGAQPLAVTMNDGVGHRHRGRRGAGAPASRHRLRRPADPRPGGGARLGARGGRPPRGGQHRARRQRRRDRARLGRRRGAVRPGDRPDLRPRRARRLRPGGDRAGRCHRAPRAAPGRVRATRARLDGGARPRDARVPARRRRGLRLRQQPARRRPGGRGRATRSTYPGFVPAFIRPQFCEGRGPFRWVALSGDPADIRADRSGRPRALPRRCRPPALDRDGRGAGAVPGAAGADLLAGLRRARAAPGSPSTSSCARARSPRRSSSGATTSTPARSPPRTARPRRWPTAPTRSPTGRCSTPW